MEIRQGYSYHIKDEFFNLVQDKYLMSNKEQVNILVRRSRQSGVARATNPDFESHRLLLILLVLDLNHILLA